MSTILNYFRSSNFDSELLRPFKLNEGIEKLGLKKETNLFLLKYNINTVSELINVCISEFLSNMKEYFKDKVDETLCLRDIQDRFHFYQLNFFKN